MPGNNSGFWGPYTDSYSLLDGKMPTLDRIRRVVNRDGFRATKALLNALIGAATGGTATATHSRVGHSLVATGGEDLALPIITTVTDINRTTTAADVTALKAFLVNVTERPVPYPRDLSGNGGGSLA